MAKKAIRKKVLFEVKFPVHSKWSIHDIEESLKSEGLKVAVLRTEWY